MMAYDPDKHHRRSIRMKGYDYTLPGAYFVTVCVRNQQCLFGDVANGEMVLNDAGRMVRTAWDGLPSRFSGLELDTFVVMPNHVHGIIIFVGAGLALPSHEGAASSAPTSGDSGLWQNRRIGSGRSAPTLGDAVRLFKSLSAVHANRLLMRTGPLWQRNYYEHIVRNENELNRIREYIYNNPAQWEYDRENPVPVGARRAVSQPEDEPWRV